MKAEDIAERYAVKQGYRLVDYIEVGLPVYHVILQVSALLRKRIPPLEEFVMRCLQLGMRDCEEIAAFLGLEVAIVESVVSAIIRENSVSLAGNLGTSQQSLHLTE